MTARIHAHDADGAAVARDGRLRTTVHVRGGVGATRVDLEELQAIDVVLEGVVREAGYLESALDAARRALALDAGWAPAEAASAESAVDEAVHGARGVRRLGEEAFALLMSVRYARILYEEAELAARTQLAAPSWWGFLRVLLSPQAAVGAVADRLTLVGRLPGLEPSGPAGMLVDGLAELVNLAHGDDDLPPDGLALDVAVRELGEQGQYLLPWALLSGPFTYDGRRIDPDGLTAAQRLLVPVVLTFNRLTGRGPAHTRELTIAVSPPRLVAPSRDLAAVVDSLRTVHQDHGAEPGTVEVRRTDHPDGRRTWTVLLPSTQAMVPGGSNPVDNLTNGETYSGLVSDVEIAAARAMTLAGIAPGEAVAVVGFSQGGLVAMRLAADPVVRARFDIRAVVTAGSPVAHLPTPHGTEVLHLEHLEDPFIGLDGTTNPASPERTTVSRSLATGTTGEVRFEVPPGESHSVVEYGRTAALALAAGEPSVVHASQRLAEITGGAGARVTATAYTVERG
ncbi:hypothetical protein FE251_14985 [Georgenia wutianyii]|uniref:Uncharacterized protein n=1 Tax=Georgenia wutianyii TaxID=2585135 RepID=A0ABX5VPU1_9MICO|nr:hypothetical protein [Georgenia wutianyii]QDB80529.1 hypothetical protein FE251_14985 [Georgenia wutianyii]